MKIHQFSKKFDIEDTNTEGYDDKLSPSLIIEQYWKCVDLIRFGMYSFHVRSLDSQPSYLVQTAFMKT
jgi:hypothetical protein